MRVRFVDHIMFTDDAEFEAKHKRDEDGKFSESESKGSSEQKTYYASGKDVSEIPRKKPVAEYIERMKKEDPAEVLLDFTNTELRGGYLSCNLPEIGPSKLLFSKNVCQELAKNPRKIGEKNAREILARRTLIAANDIGLLAKTGRRSQWQESEKEKHKGDRFLKIIKVFKDVDGEKYPAVLVIRKPNRAPVHPYALPVKANGNLRRTLKNTKFKDGETGELIIESLIVNG